MGTKEEADQIGFRNPSQIDPSFERVADTIEETPSSDEHQELPSRALESFVTIEESPSSLIEEEGVCRICLDEVGEDSPTLTMECGCKGRLALAHQDCALKWFTLKGNKICEVCKQEVHNLTFTPFEASKPDRWNRSHEETFKLVLVATLAYFCVIETLTVQDRQYGFGSTFESLLFSAMLGAFTSCTSTALVWSKYVWVYAAAQFGLVLLAAHFIPIPTGHPNEPTVAFPSFAWGVIGFALASVIVNLFCGFTIDCVADIRHNVAAKRRARLCNGSNQQHNNVSQLV